MKLRRRIIHTSFHFSADFLAYYKGEKLVKLVVEGYSLPINGEVDVETFKSLLRMIRTKEKAVRNVWEGKPERTYKSVERTEAIVVKAESRSIWMATESTLSFTDWRFENFPKW